VLIAIFDPYSGVAGDMTLGALVACGLDPAFIVGLPARLGLEGVTAQVTTVVKKGITCTKVDFDIPPQPHGRHVPAILKIIAACDAPESVKASATAAFVAMGTVEAEVHNTTLEKVHLHEVGAVDAILDIVGSIWGLHLLGVERVYVTPIQVGDGTVTAAHGVRPVPAPATAKLLTGFPVRYGPEGAGELTTPTGATLMKVLAVGAPPSQYTLVRSGFGAGTKDLPDRANALRVTLAEVQDPEGDAPSLIMLTADIDDMTGELLSAAADVLRSKGALDVWLLATQMKKGRPAVRIEVLCDAEAAETFTQLLFVHTTTLGVRRTPVTRRTLPREMIQVTSYGEPVGVKVATLPDGSVRAKPEFDDVARVALATGQSAVVIAADALHAAQHVLKDRRRLAGERPV
jgi:uncharacterized protein (TIGR00299 family) protein